jgi:molybdate transport system regulatory protein
MELRFKSWIEHGGKMVFGEGLNELLSGIRTYGSIARAAAGMGLAYREAWGRLRQAEAALGAPLLERRTGGPRGGGAVLTPLGEHLVEAFSVIEDRLAGTVQQLEEEFLRRMPDLAGK